VCAAVVICAGADASNEAPLQLSLKEATTRAMAESRRIKKAKAEYAAAAADSDIARTAFMPTLSFTSKTGTLHDRDQVPGDREPPVTARDRNHYEAQLLLRQNLFSGFSDLHNVRASNARRSEGEWALKSTALDVSLDVIEQYFGLQLAKAELDAELQIFKLREQQFTEARSRAAQGRATSLELLESEYAVRAQEPVIKSLESDIASKSLRLARLAGLPLDKGFTLTDALTDVGAVLGSSKLPELDKAYAEALEQSPELKRAEATWERLDWERARDTARHLPTVSIDIAAGYRSGLRSDFGTEDTLRYSGLVTLDVPLFSGLGSFDERRKNSALLSAAAEEQAMAREQLLQDLTDAYRQLDLAEAKVAAERKNKELTSKAVENARNLFRNGRATQANLLDSYSRDLAALRNHARSLYDRVIAIAKIRMLTSP
jgi:adhesin transport system outer membrane protein